VSYGLQLGLEEGFQANHVDFFTIPGLYGFRALKQPPGWVELGSFVPVDILIRYGWESFKTISMNRF